MATKTFGVLGASVLAAGLIGFWLGRTAGAPPAPPASAPPASVRSLASGADRPPERALSCRGVDVASLKNDLRQIVREELASQRAPEREVDPGVDDGREPPPARETRALAAADPESHARAERLVEEALRSHRLSQDGNVELQMLLSRLPDEQRIALVSRLYSAINEGTVVPDVPRRSL
jgi:hypothetical protein